MHSNEQITIIQEKLALLELLGVTLTDDERANLKQDILNISTSQVAPPPKPITVTPSASLTSNSLVFLGRRLEQLGYPNSNANRTVLACRLNHAIIALEGASRPKLDSKQLPAQAISASQGCYMYYESDLPLIDSLIVQYCVK